MKSDSKPAERKLMNKAKEPYWTQKTHLFVADEYICSVCGHSAKKPYTECPHCGSEMRKKKYSPTWVDEAEFMEIFFGD